MRNGVVIKKIEIRKVEVLFMIRFKLIEDNKSK